MEILSACQVLGIKMIQEYRDEYWSADVCIPNNSKHITFEIQLSTVLSLF